LARSVDPASVTNAAHAGFGAVVGVAGCGVTGARAATLLAASTMPDGRPVGVAVYDPDQPAARALAASIRALSVGRVEDLAVADVVVFCHPHPHRDAAADFVDAGVGVVSSSDDPDDVVELLELHRRAAQLGVPLVVGAAMAPGLSGLLARYLADQLAHVEELHVAVNGTGGPACARRHHDALGSRSLGWHDGEWILRPGGSGRELCWFPGTSGAADCYRAAHADPVLLHRSFPEVQRISAKVSATRRDRLTARLPMLRPPHVGGNLGAVRVEARGAAASGARETVIAGAAGRAAGLAGAVCAAAAMACAEGRVDGGAHTPGGSGLVAAGLLGRVTAYGVTVVEFTGVPRPTTW
jgi:hypothetical protein